MGQLLLVRHAQKGNGKETGKKFHLSPAGQLDSLELGRNLPEEFAINLKFVGGSELSRSFHAALLIAIGAGVDPQILHGDKRLGSENQLFGEFAITMDAYVTALAKNGNSEIDALRTVCTEAQYALLKSQICEAIHEALRLDGNVVLGTHSPWLQLAIEVVTGQEYHANVDELDWIMIDLVDNKLIITNSHLA